MPQTQQLIVLYLNLKRLLFVKTNTKIRTITTVNSCEKQTPQTVTTEETHVKILILSENWTSSSKKKQSWWTELVGLEKMLKYRN